MFSSKIKTIIRCRNVYNIISVDYYNQRRFISIIDRVDGLIRYPKLRKKYEENPSSVAIQCLNNINRSRTVLDLIQRNNVKLNDIQIYREYLRALTNTKEIYRVSLPFNKMIDSLNIKDSSDDKSQFPTEATTMGSKNDPLYINVEHRPSWISLLIYLFGFVAVAYMFIFDKIVMTTDMYKPEISKTHFTDVEGIDDVKQEIAFLVEYLKNPHGVVASGAKIPHGVLMTGPPGCGKTLLAKALAGEARVPFYYASGAEFEDMYVGVGAKRIRNLFETARAHAPSIIFIDELDAVGGKRDMSTIHPYDRITINQLLTEMSGFKDSEGVVVIAATNLPKVLDPALIRPGRFDLHVEIPLPDYQGRINILRRHCFHSKKGGKKTFSKDIDLSRIASFTPGLTGADLENIVNQAALNALLENSPVITQKHLEDSLEKIYYGKENKSSIIPPSVRENTAYHEAGHATISVLYKREDASYKIRSASIIPRGMALGMVTQLPSEESIYQNTKAQMLHDIVVCMGGRVGEELMFGKENVTAGAVNDFMQASDLARKLVMMTGFGDNTGLEVYNDKSINMLSDKKKREMDLEVKKILDNAYVEAYNCIESNRDSWMTLAEYLLRYEKLTGDEVETIFSTGSLPMRK